MIQKLERKYGRYAIHNLMKYIIMLYALGFILDMISPNFYRTFLMLDIDAVLHGQVWRLITFIIQPIAYSNPLFLFISLYFYYMIGNSLENAWGAFRFNLYFISGIIFNVLAVVVIYVATKVMYGVGYSYPVSLDYINESMFFAFAAIYPNVQVLLMYIIPIKVKYLAYAYGAMIGYNIIKIIRLEIAYPGNGIIFQLIVILFALANFIIFFMSSRNYRRISPREIKRRQTYKRKVRQSSYGNVTQFRGNNVVTRHKCAVCGRTELDDDNLEFRFCSKCEGNYEYCMNCLFTHEHVKKH